MLTVLAAYAQEESLSASENQKWRIKRNFEQGKIGNIKMLGTDETKTVYLKLCQKKPETIRMIFQDYLSGMGKLSICNKLNEMHSADYPSRKRLNWCRLNLEERQSAEFTVSDLISFPQKLYALAVVFTVQKYGIPPTKYRRVIWQCFHKFQNGEKCSTPHLREDTIREKFVQAFNLISANKEDFLSSCCQIRDMLSDCTEIDDKIGALQTS